MWRRLPATPHGEPRAICSTIWAATPRLPSQLGCSAVYHCWQIRHTIRNHCETARPTSTMLWHNGQQSFHHCVTGQLLCSQLPNTSNQGRRLSSPRRSQSFIQRRKSRLLVKSTQRTSLECNCLSERPYSITAHGKAEIHPLLCLRAPQPPKCAVT